LDIFFDVLKCALQSFGAFVDVVEHVISSHGNLFLAQYGY
jgi:hypothetical protein